MAEFAAIPLFTDSYLADTRHLSTEEHGAYLLLLFEAWRRPDCNLPDDDALLSRLAGLPIDRWRKIKPVIMAFWVRDGRRKTWTQKRLLKERRFVTQKSASQRNNAAKRWKEKKNEYATALPDGCQTDAPTPTPSVTVANATGAGAPPDPAKVMFDSGRVLLMASGKSRDAAGKLLGKWRADFGPEAVIVALGKAQREGAIDPVAFVEGVLRQRARLSSAPQIGDRKTNPAGQTIEFAGENQGWVKVWE